MFTADHVWALAVAAQRINGEYLKEDRYVWDEEEKTSKPVKLANKKMLKQWLREEHNPTTEADIEEGRECRNYFKGYLMRELSGKINDFERSALKIAQKDEFSPRDMYDFSVVACLPMIAVRDRQRQEIKRELYSSEQLEGSVGDSITGDITVISSNFNQNYCKWIINARMGESFISFWYTKEVKGELRIKGKIKAQRGDKTTQLNYVKIIG